MIRTAALAAMALAAAGCASTGETQVASADCKVMPITTSSVAGRAPRNVSPIEQRFAEMQLANSPYRQRQLRERGLQGNAVEDALRDCNR